ncbi:pesticin C-terminus-like muramidase [Shewanella sp. VB17]|uniref:pesticin C-terminus-like muramidase n=1 Tax=Shewanella sp. VB17 TaxID=2739432 RepID=UPI0020B6B2F9|nr:pesticin C-terminus-like muramidase [Shewanella sp. VB17]
MIDFVFIEALEGNTGTAYVPDPDNSHSGVTIGCGFDLGARSCSELEVAFSPALTGKLTPYVGLKKHQAVKALQRLPLILNDAEVYSVNAYAKCEAVTRLNLQWQRSAACIAFDKLPIPCQTVIASVAFQYGDLARRTPHFWQQVTRGSWSAALDNLQNFGDNYPSRRKKEAALLKAWLDNSVV